MVMTPVVVHGWPRTVVLAVLLMSAAGAVASDPEPTTVSACERAVSRLWPQWRLAVVSNEVREWARARGVTPTRVRGDFDGDRAEDVALLVQVTDDPRSARIAACLSSRGGEPVVVEQPYCRDGITRAEKGQRYYDFELDREGVYPHDGVHAYCFERAGATYIYLNGKFERIVDSD